MFFTHHFAHHETLTRAHSWLSRLGYTGAQVEAHADGVPRLVMALDPSQHAGMTLLINAIERSDPDGWPSFWEIARLHHPCVSPDCVDTTPASVRPGTESIGWHPVDPASDPLPPVH